MARTVLTDELWAQLQNTMKQHGCYITPNTRIILIQTVGQAGCLIADKGYNSNAIIKEAARKQGIHPVIPKRRTAKGANIGFDRYLYKLRHLIENLFARLKQFRSIATRYEKNALSGLYDYSR